MERRLGSGSEKHIGAEFTPEKVESFLRRSASIQGLNFWLQPLEHGRMSPGKTIWCPMPLWFPKG